MKLNANEAIVIRSLNENRQRHVYQAGNGLWYINCQGPGVEFTTEQVEEMERRGVLRLDFPGFYRLSNDHAQS